MRTSIKTLLHCFAILYGLCLPPQRVAAQGFDHIYNYANSIVQSRYRTVLADSQRIILAGVARNGDSVSACNSIVSFISAYNYAGNLLWKKQLSFPGPIFNGNEIQASYALVKLEANKYAVTLNGYLCDLPNSYAHAAIFLFNGDGDSLGFYRLPSGSTETHLPYALQTDNQHNLLMGGFFLANANSVFNPAFLAKFTPAGQPVWKKVLSEADSAAAPISTVLKILAGNRPNEYVLGGYKHYGDSTSPHTTDAIWKTDTAGNTLWQRNLPKYPGWVNSYDGDAQLSIINASNGTGYYFATIGTKPIQFPGEDPSYRAVYYCGKLDENGQVVWAKTYELDTLGNAGGLSLAQKRNGDLLIGGASWHIITTEHRELTGCNLICTDSSGHVKWMKIHKHFSDCSYEPEQTLTAMSLSPTESIVRAGGISQVDQQSCWFVAGSISWLLYTDSLGRLNANDTVTWTLKEEPVNYNPNAIKEPHKPLPGIHIYPNPGKGIFNIRLDAPAQASLSVFDAAGKQLLRQTLKGTGAQVDLSGYPAGLYLFRLADGTGQALLQTVVKE